MTDHTQNLVGIMGDLAQNRKNLEKQMADSKAAFTAQYDAGAHQLEKFDSLIAGIQVILENKQLIDAIATQVAVNAAAGGGSPLSSTAAVPSAAAGAPSEPAKAVSEGAAANS